MRNLDALFFKFTREALSRSVEPYANRRATYAQGNRDSFTIKGLPRDKREDLLVLGVKASERAVDVSSEVTLRRWLLGEAFHVGGEPGVKCRPSKFTAALVCEDTAAHPVEPRQQTVVVRGVFDASSSRC